MDYIEILKRAYKITLKHKFLWIFGILAGGAAGFKGFDSSIPNSSFGGGDVEKKMTEWSSTNITNVDWTAFWSHYGGLILGLLAVFALLAVIFFVLNIISQGALIGSSEKMAKGEKADFKIGFDIGWHNFWRIWGLGLTFLLMILISLAILISPVAILIATGQFIMAGILGVLLFMVCVAFWLLIGIISPYALRVVVLKKLSVFDSIREGLHLVRDNFIEVILMYLLLFAVSIGYGLITGLAALLAGGILLAIGFGFWLASPIAAVIYGIIIGIVFIAVLVTIGGAFNAFYSTAITLTYLKLTSR